MKFLCVCQGGRVRSGAMAWALKDVGQDSLAAGWEATSSETLKMLCEWADGIVLMQEEFIAKLEAKIGKGCFDPRKLLIVDVGPDVFGTPTHDALLPYVRGIAMQWKEKDFKLMSATGHVLPLVMV
jgi:predicted protein tyrosine phosphatase